MHAKKMSSSSFESEYVKSSYESESGSDDTFSEDESDSEETRSESLDQVERTSKRGNDSDSARDEGSLTLPLTQKIISEIQDGHMLAQIILSISKRKHQEREERSKKRTKQPIEDPPIDSATISLGNDESNAESGNLVVEGHEQLQQHQQPPEEEEPPHQQQPPQQQQQPQQQIIHISSSSEDEPKPTPITMLICKTEGDIVSSPMDMLLTDALIRMSQEEQPPPQEEDNNPAQIEEHPPRLERQDEEAPS
ncbi:hypothetical protein PIB30_088832 [Stylosanthes scabra]|uniref:Uncharacterized protein n=1 Tax=Stylosanthes scabra TaxID=79078 RepID=A0ABU6XT63_9FABA|nr:hypothetical protein [Stylosanthes scabra]